MKRRPGGTFGLVSARGAREHRSVDSTDADSPEHEPALSAGDRIERYEIRAVLGVGGMGEVYEAFDPRLERTIALKIIRPEQATSRTARARLLREAQAMASVVHPNVLPVFEAGGERGHVFIAMERVLGQTLEEWSAQAHGAREIVDVFLQAGQGLAAAHAAGIMHRDFKPANVLVGEDGRVRVLDFGLASAVGAVTASSRDEVEAESAPTRDSLTQTGIVLGTPMYMAPEQHLGEPADARCDQYAFCVAMFEALYGTCPFVADSMKELLVAKLERAPASVPPRRGVSRRMHQALVRGMRPEPPDRWSSMDALLRELRPHARTLRWAAAGVGLCGLAAAWFAVAPADASRSISCEQAATEAMAEVWNDERRARAQQAFEATQRPYADRAWLSVNARIGRWQDGWIHEQSEACRATRAGQDTQPRLDCLARGRRELDAVSEILVTADVDTVRRSSSLIQVLMPPSRCVKASAREAEPVIADPTLAALAEDVRRRLAQVDARARVARYDEARSMVEALVQELEPGQLPGLQADALVSLGLRLDSVGRYDEVAAHYERAYAIALEHGDDRRAVLAASQLVFSWTVRTGEPDRAEEWARHAQAAYARLGDAPDVERRMLIALAAFAAAKADPDAALEYDRRRVELAKAQYGTGSLETAAALHAHGHRLTAQGRYDQARGILTEAYEIRRRELGPRHPEVATSLYGLAMLDHLTGQLPRAREHYLEALSIREDELGPEHPELGGLLNNLGSISGVLGHDDEARKHYERALAIHEAAKGPDHPHCALPHNNLGLLLSAVGEYEQALEHHRRALAISEAAYGPEHIDLAYALGGMADVHLARGELETALPLFERVLALRVASDRNPANLGQARFSVAKVLRETGGDRSRALALGREAREDFASLGEIHREQIEQIDQWLAAQG